MARKSTVGGLAAAAVLSYALMWVGWTAPWGWLTRIDDAALDAARRAGAAHGGWATFWDLWCTVFSPVTFRVLTVGLIVYEFVRHYHRRGPPPPDRRPSARWGTAVFLILSVELSGVVTEIAKRLADRPRPPTAMVDALSTSFPSGHALGSMVALLAVAIVYLPRIGRNYWPWLIAAGVAVVVSVGVGRVALNVHHPSDIVAGWALGYLWVVVCLRSCCGGVVREAAETPAVRGSGR